MVIIRKYKKFLTNNIVGGWEREIIIFVKTKSQKLHSNYINDGGRRRKIYYVLNSERSEIISTYIKVLGGSETTNLVIRLRKIFGSTSIKGGDLAKRIYYDRNKEKSEISLKLHYWRGG